MNPILLVPVKIVSTEAKVSNKNPAAPKNFWITSLYAQLPGMLYPQACEQFIGDVTKVLPPGDYLIPVKFSIKDKRPNLDELDFSAAQPVTASKAA